MPPLINLIMDKVKRFYKFPDTVYFDDFRIQENYIAETNQLINVFPYINVIQFETDIQVQVLLPMVDTTNIGVNVKETSVVISSAGNEQTESTDFFVKEFAIPQFIRTINLPFKVNKKEVQQELKNGILFINLKKI